MIKIVLEGDPVLRGKAKEVPVHDITSPKIKKVIKDMKAALAGEKYGAAIAAPQIGEPLRIFIVSGRVKEPVGQEEDGTLRFPDDMVFINPIISKKSREKEPMDEGCLSVRGLYGIVERSSKATVSAYDENGKKITIGARGLLAQVFQHETDHLDGTLFIDKAIETWKVRDDFEDAHEARKTAAMKKKALSAKKKG